jgi:hypothetical protein
VAWPASNSRAIIGSLFAREVVPFYLSLLALALATLAIDAALHLADLVWVGKWLGIPGLALICGSFGYSLRKRKLISRGRPVTLLRLHERMAWAGSLLILVHAGIHFNAWLGWMAIWAMLLNVASGLTGKFLLRRARLRLTAKSDRLHAEGLKGAALEERLHWDSLTYAAVKQWKVLHVPVTLAFAILAAAHVISALIFWGGA